MTEEELMKKIKVMEQKLKDREEVIKDLEDQLEECWFDGMGEDV